MKSQTITQSAKVENCRAQKRVRSVSVDAGARACINCIWYEQYYRASRAHFASFVPACAGNCLLHDRCRSPMGQTCRDFEIKTPPSEVDEDGRGV